LRIDLLKNQYLLIKNSKGDIVDEYKFDGQKTLKVKYRLIESNILDKIKPRNSRQKLFFDLLQSDIPLKVVSGVPGSGKTMISTAWALQELQRGNFNKLIVIKNNVGVQDVPELGALPGDVTEKLKASCAFIGDIVSDFMFDTLLQNNKIEIAYLGTMRGRNLSECVVLVSEAQNLTTNLVKMIVTRIGEKSVLIFDYDLEQIDKKVFEKDNGMMSLTESLQGNDLFGMVELDRIERSAVARLAELIK
jgi:PhoH-like ATPase